MSAFGAQFNMVRRQAGRHRILSELTHSCNDLLASSRVLSRDGEQTIILQELRQVPIHQIVGSSGRVHDFDLSFRPHNDALEERWTQIALANSEGVGLPPVLLVQIGEAFFVEDGHHRISVARAGRQQTINAWVTELDSSGMVENSGCTRLGFEV